MDANSLANFRFPTPEPVAPHLVQIKTAAGMFDISPDLVRRLIERGQLKPYRLGRRILIDPDELLTLASRNAGRQA